MNYQPQPLNNSSPMMKKVILKDLAYFVSAMERLDSNLFDEQELVYFQQIKAAVDQWQRKLFMID